jgi:hypothetical protein
MTKEVLPQDDLWEIELIQIREEYTGKLFSFRDHYYLILSIEKAKKARDDDPDQPLSEAYQFTLLGKRGIYHWYEIHPVCLGSFIDNE